MKITILKYGNLDMVIYLSYRINMVMCNMVIFLEIIGNMVMCRIVILLDDFFFYISRERQTSESYSWDCFALTKGSKY